jgi:5'(3')-deoxyribonucleotidase
MKKKIIYIDMDGVISDFSKARNEHPLSKQTPYIGRPDRIPNIYKDLDPITNSIESVNKIINSDKFDLFFLSTPPWDNPDAWTHKRLWIEKYFGHKVRHKLILSARKDLNIGDYLIDDSKFRGQPNFNGKWIEFGSERFPNWETVLNYLKID